MMMASSLSLLLLALTTTGVLAAPFTLDDEYPEVVVTQKRAALVLDRLLVALRNALEKGPAANRPDMRRRVHTSSPQALPLRVSNYNDVMGVADADTWSADGPRGPVAMPLVLPDYTSSLQRRGQTGAARGRVLRCYFNAVTCF